MKSEVRITVTPLFVDKIVLESDPVALPLESTFRNAERAAQRLEEKRRIRDTSKLGRRKNYHCNYSILRHGKQIAFLQWNPRQKKQAFMRLDFNPTQIGVAGIERIIHVMKDLFEDLFEISLVAMRIKKIHLAVDVLDVSIENLQIHDKSKTQGMIFQNNYDRHGRLMRICVIRSQYMGSPRSIRQVKAYDKTMQVKQVKGEEPDRERTRVETMLNFRKAVEPSYLVRELRNPFQGVGISILTDEAASARVSVRSGPSFPVETKTLTMVSTTNGSGHHES